MSKAAYRRKSTKNAPRPSAPSTAPQPQPQQPALNRQPSETPLSSSASRDSSAKRSIGIPKQAYDINTILDNTKGGHLGGAAVEGPTEASHDIHTYGYTGIDSIVIGGPTSSIKDFTWFTRRLSRVHFGMFAIMILVGFQIAEIQFIVYILPNYLAAKNVSRSILLNDSMYSIFNGWISISVSMFMVFYGLALMQYPKDIQWWKVGQIRWVLLIVLEIYLIAGHIFYVVQLKHVHNDTRILLDLAFKQKGDDTYMDEIQEYYHCCGVEKWQDWENKTHTWWNGLCNKSRIHNEHPFDLKNVSFELHSHSPEACKVPTSCWDLDRGKDLAKVNFTLLRRRKVYKVSCLEWEDHLAYSLIASFAIVVILIAFLMLMVFGYLRWLIRKADKSNTDLQPKILHEECMQ